MCTLRLSHVFFLLLIPFVVCSQRTVCGYVTDAENKEPVPGASVFMANTTVGTTTDSTGYYQLKIPEEGSFVLTVSYVGYQPAFRDIEPGNTPVLFDAALKILELDEVTVSAKVRFRQRDINLFWKTLLGKTPSKKSIYAINPEAVYYYYNSKTGILTVTCREPLHIINNETGYHIRYVLDHFSHDYTASISSWEGKLLFTELKPENYRQKNSWDNNRKKIYQVSLAYFIKALYHHSLMENGYLLTYPAKEDRPEYWRKGLYENPGTLLSDISPDGGKTFHIPSLVRDLILVCFGRPVTEHDLIDIDMAQIQSARWPETGLFRNVLQTPGAPVRIFPDGTYSNPLLLFPCFISNSLLGLNMKLPVEYSPDFDAEAMPLIAGEIVSEDDVSAVSEDDIFDENLFVKRFREQLRVFPQEKIYLHTDKPYYISGERIWFRAHLADAATHVPSPVSRYVYAELINPLDSVVTRVKIRQEEDAYHGCLIIPGDAPEGDYTLRAYTTFMRSLDEHYFFTKSVHIGNPLSRQTAAGAQNMPNRQNIHVSQTENDLDVSFYPESDSIMQGFDCSIAFNRGYALSVNRVNDMIYVSVLKPAEVVRNDELHLLAHTRGIVQFADVWDHGKNLISFHSDQFPSGVLQFVLFDADMNPLSERLVFINSPEDQALVAYHPDKENFAPRSLIKNRVTVTGSEGQPLTGSISVAVTSDREVTPDSTTSILTQLLLVSDLRGHIENPAFYFQGTPASAWALDSLMRTQGWRRYDMARLAKGCFTKPAFPLESGAEISGTVKSVLSGNPVENMEVTVFSFNENQETGYFDNTKTDKDGRFHLRGCDLPDNTGYIVSVEPDKGMARMNLLIDDETFPERNLPAVPPAAIDRAQFAKYAEKAEQQYTSESGMRTYHLSEVSVTAERKQPARKSAYYSSPDNSITWEDPDQKPSANIFILLQMLPGITVSVNPLSGEHVITIHGTELGEDTGVYYPPLLIVDDVPVNNDYLNSINVNDIVQIDLLKNTKAGIYGMRGAKGVIAIFTRTGKEINKREIPPFHIKTFLPLGYQQPVEFYAPKYDTSEKRNAQSPDLRSTIHWQPVVQTDSLGVASFEFYTADESTSYTVIIEGLTDDGRIIRHEGKIWRREDNSESQSY